MVFINWFEQHLNWIVCKPFTKIIIGICMRSGVYIVYTTCLVCCAHTLAIAGNCKANEIKKKATIRRTHNEASRETHNAKENEARLVHGHEKKMKLQWSRDEEQMTHKRDASKKQRQTNGIYRDEKVVCNGTTVSIVRVLFTKHIVITLKGHLAGGTVRMGCMHTNSSYVNLIA